jgi:hypothetical protein
MVEINRVFDADQPKTDMGLEYKILRSKNICLKFQNNTNYDKKLIQSNGQVERFTQRRVNNAGLLGLVTSWVR